MNTRAWVRNSVQASCYIYREREHQFLPVRKHPLIRRYPSSKMTKICGVKALPFLALVLVLTVMGEQGQAHPCGSTFFSALIQMIPCRAAVAPFSPIQPSEACCNAVKTLGQPCLCTLVNGPPISGVDRNMALQLPDKCTANFEPCEIMKK